MIYLLERIPTAYKFDRRVLTVERTSPFAEKRPEKITARLKDIVVAAQPMIVSGFFTLDLGIVAEIIVNKPVGRCTAHD